jgi:hypothetical protein
MCWQRASPPCQIHADFFRYGLQLPLVSLRLLRQASEQYFTSSQFFSHFFRHEKGRWHTGQIFWGRSCFFTDFTLWIIRPFPDGYKNKTQTLLACVLFFLNEVKY